MKQEGKGRLRVGVGDAVKITRTLKKRGATLLKLTLNLYCLVSTPSLYFVS